MQFLGTRVIGIDIDSQYIVADVVSDGAVLAHSVGVDEYITNLLKQIDALKAEVKNLDEGAKLLHSVAMNGEQSVLSRLDNGIDAVDAQRWKDDRCYESASSKHVSVPICNGAVCIACGDTTDPRTPAQKDADEQDADWHAQVSEMRS